MAHSRKRIPFFAFTPASDLKQSFIPAREGKTEFRLMKAMKLCSTFLFDGSDFEYPKGMIYSALCLPDGGTGLDND